MIWGVLPQSSHKSICSQLYGAQKKVYGEPLQGFPHGLCSIGALTVKLFHVWRDSIQHGINTLVAIPSWYRSNGKQEVHRPWHSASGLFNLFNSRFWWGGRHTMKWTYPLICEKKYKNEIFDFFFLHSSIVHNVKFQSCCHFIKC